MIRKGEGGFRRQLSFLRVRGGESNSRKSNYYGPSQQAITRTNQFEKKGNWSS